MEKETSKLNNNYVAATSSGYVSLSSQVLTAATRQKLVDLGVDTKYIKTEDDGQAALDEAEAQVLANKKEQENLENTKKENDLHYRLRLLAREVGVTINEYEPLSKMIERTRVKFKEMFEDKEFEAGNLKSNEYKQEYFDILNRYLKAQNDKRQLDESMNTLAYYNKLYQTLTGVRMMY